MRRPDRLALLLAVLFGFVLLAAGCDDGGDGDDDMAQPPEAPSNLTATGEGDHVNLSWQGNSSNGGGFRIYYREHGAADFAHLQEVGADTTSFVHEAGYERHYDYVVTAYNDVSESDYSNIADAQTAPNAPTNLSAQADYGDTVQEAAVHLSWGDNSDVEDGYIVERQTAKGWEQIADLPADTARYVDEDVECWANYQYRVKTYNDAGSSDSSNISETTPDCWRIYMIDSEGDVGLYGTSIAIDPGGAVHISYRDRINDDLKYATDSSGSWETCTIDSEGYVGGYSSIATDSDGAVHISYDDEANDDLKYATNSSGSWMIYTIDSEGDVGEYSSIAIDSDGAMHISYFNREPNYDLKYATNKSGNWQVYTIDSEGYVGLHTSIAVDSDGVMHISYFDWEPNYDLKYATNKSGNWQVYTIDSEGYVGLHTSIAVDSEGSVHISYYEDAANYNNLKYATNRSGSWRIYTIDSEEYVGRWTSMAIDSKGAVHISYYDDLNAALKYATNRSGSWKIYTIDSEGNVGWWGTSIATGPDGFAHISYYDSFPNYDLKYATNAEVE